MSIQHYTALSKFIVVYIISMKFTSFILKKASRELLKKC